MNCCTSTGITLSSEGLVLEHLEDDTAIADALAVFVLQNAQILKWKLPWPKSIPAVTLLMYSYISSAAGTRSKCVSPGNYLTNSAEEKAWEGHISKLSQIFSPVCGKLPNICWELNCLLISQAYLLLWVTLLGVSCSTDTARSGRASAPSWRCGVLLVQSCQCLLTVHFPRKTGYVVPNWMWGGENKHLSRTKVIVLIHQRALVCSV